MMPRTYHGHTTGCIRASTWHSHHPQWSFIKSTVYHIWLVVLTILKNMKVNGKDDIAYTMENKKCLKPQTCQCM